MILLLVVFNVFIIAAPLSFGHYFNCICILGKKWNSKIFFLYFAPMLIFQSIGNFILLFLNINVLEMSFLEEYIWNLIFSLYVFWLSFLLFKNSHIPFTQIFFTSSISYFIVFSFTMTIESLILYYEPIDFRVLSAIPLILFYGALPYFLGAICTVLLGAIFYKIRFRLYIPSFYSTKLRRFMSVISSILLINPYLLLHFFLRDEENIAISVIYTFLFVFIILLIVFVFGVIFQTQKRLQLQQTILSQQSTYMETMKGLHTEMRAFRHDFQNLILGIDSHLSVDDLSGVKEFLESMSIYFDKRIGNELKHLENLMNLEHLLLKNLLSAKLIEMQKSNIEVLLSIPYPVKYINMSIIRCVGICLDNAKEATENMENGVVKILLLQESESLKIHIENTFEEEPILSKIGSKGYSTKGNGRGIGLFSYRSIIKRYDHIMSRTLCENGIFTQELHIFNSKGAL